LFSIAVAAAGPGTGGVALACDQCRLLGTTVLHGGMLGGAIGGDSHDDAFAPAAPIEEGMASAQFLQFGGKFSQPDGLGSPVTITYSYYNMFDGGLKDINDVPLPAALIRGSIEEAFGAWAAHAPLHFVEVPDQGTGLSLIDYPDGQFGQIRISHLPINGRDIPGQPPIAKAMARYPNAGGNIASDVFFDSDDPWQEMGTQSQPDILGAMIHELGHTLGLAHSEFDTANMFWIFHRFSGLGTGQLFADDIAGIQSIYGAGVGSVTPLAVPEPASGALLAVALVWCLGTCRRRR
jgi:hypothetical protein